MPPQALPSAKAWPQLNAADDEYRRVKFRATFDNAPEALVFASATAFRPDVSGPGYWVFAPARLADGGVVMVNRGFVPDGRQDPKSRPGGQLSGPVDIVGAMRWPDTRHWFTPNDDPAHNLWFARDPAGDRRRQEYRSGRAVLCRAGGAGSPGRLTATRQARRQPAGQPSAIRHHLVWLGGGPSRGFHFLCLQFAGTKRRRRGRRADQLGPFCRFSGPVSAPLALSLKPSSVAAARRSQGEGLP